MGIYYCSSGTGDVGLDQAWTMGTGVLLDKNRCLGYDCYLCLVLGLLYDA